MERIKRYLVIGASSEVGTAFLKLLDQRARVFAGEEGVQVTAHCHTGGKVLSELAKDCPHLKISTVSCDLGNQEQVEAFAKQLEQEEAYQGFLYLAAGKMQYEKLKKAELSRLKEDFQIQVQALARISQAVLPGMAKAGFGKAVVMLSECTLGMPPRFSTRYTTVKYAALGLMRSLAMEYADKNISVNGISPAMMDTKFLSEIDPRLIEMSMGANRKKRSLTVEETAEGIAFLFSKGADYMNGVNLNLSGGNQV